MTFWRKSRWVFKQISPREAKPKLSANKEQLLRSELVVYLTIYRRGGKIARGCCWMKELLISLGKGRNG